MKNIFYLVIFMALITIINCSKATKEPVKQVTKTATIIQTSKSGDKLTEKRKIEFNAGQPLPGLGIILNPAKKFQEIVGIGGSFTESSAQALQRLSPDKRTEVINAYFSKDGAAYSLTRTHIASCDFSASTYTYANTPGKDLADFSIEPDQADLIPLIKDAMAAPGANFKIIASPWTAPAWMKENKNWNGGKLLPEHYPTFALFIAKYLKAYAAQGINIWGITPVNEPLGNGGQWESMDFTPVEMADFVKNHLGPLFAQDSLNQKILIYDQNRDQVRQWADTILGDPEAAKYVYGTAVHWYSSTIEWYPTELTYVHDTWPTKQIIQTEGCIDSEVPVWQDDAWYWSKKATDWGFQWAPEADKHLHPEYVPVYRYARDLIGGINSWLAGWIDWNIVLDDKGGPNHANNWCIAPVIVKPDSNEVYYTPLYYVMAHFSKYIRPGAYRIEVATPFEGLMVTACQNPDGSIVVAILNQSDIETAYQLALGDQFVDSKIEGQALQTVVIK